MRLFFAVGVLAMSLSACTTKKQPPVAGHSPLADSADQIMYNSRFVLTDEGIARAQMHADTAYFFDDNTRMEFENPNVTFSNSMGAKDAVLTARHGTLNNRTNNMIARKNVVVVSEDGRRLTTPELIYNKQKNEISSDSAFVMTEPGRELSGIGFRSDPNMNNIRILKGASGIARGVSTQATSPSQRPAAQPSATQRPSVQRPTASPTASSTPLR
ncbi:MAG TPA: LPS export ABC transporter periplasmic protein LptC [Gemmatimonadaceae bacterium]|nr:LPS export ABC transporter periplasmic protein LptC [Gemmatimonadaceae bacterium]